MSSDHCDFCSVKDVENRKLKAKIAVMEFQLLKYKEKLGRDLFPQPEQTTMQADPTRFQKSEGKSGHDYGFNEAV